MCHFWDWSPQIDEFEWVGRNSLRIIFVRYLSIKNAIIGADCFHFYFSSPSILEKNNNSIDSIGNSRKIGSTIKTHLCAVEWFDLECTAHGNENEIEVNFECETINQFLLDKRRKKIGRTISVFSIRISTTEQYTIRTAYFVALFLFFFYFICIVPILFSAFTNWLLSHRNHMVKVLQTNTYSHITYESKWRQHTAAATAATTERRYKLTCTNKPKTHRKNL